MDPHAPGGDEAAAAPGAAAAPLTWRFAAQSDVGRVRKDNQDSGYAGPHLLVIADGVGGAARGDVASSTAIAALRRIDGPPEGDLLESLAGAIHRAHDRIAELVEESPELEGTSTTITSVFFDGARIGVGHVGDSRGYLLRDGALSQLTRDHTFVQTLVDEGRITEEESRSHPHRNLILRAVDGVHDTDPDLFTVDLAPGDRLLLCSDGACGVLDATRLTDILGTGSVEYAAVELIRAALEAGTSDNVTAVVADVVGAGEAPAAEPLVVGAAAEQARRGRSLFRGHRGGDTGEIEPVAGGDEDPASESGAADAEDLRYAPRAPRRGRWLRLVASLVVVALLVGAAAYVAYRWSQDQYYVAVHEGRVAIYQGVQADIPGLKLHHVAERTDVTVAALSPYYTEQVSAGISADSRSAAGAIVRRLTRVARPCSSPSPSPSATPSATSPSPSGTARPKTKRPKASASPTTSPSPTASPSPTLAPPDCIEAAS